MRTTKHWLMTIAALLCSVCVNAATYPDWTSTNKGQSSTTSSNTYTISANAGEVLTFDWLVSSESNYDKLIITIGGTEILNKSGELSGRYQYTFTSSGTYTMVVKYTKDGSVDRGSDYAKVYNITLGTGDAGGSDNSGTENIVASGTCGDNLTWKLTDESVLFIEGTGYMYSYDGGNLAPWRPYSNNITSVVISEGVTSIGKYAFFNCVNLTSITIPESMTSIGSNAFDNTAWYGSQPEGLLYLDKWVLGYKGEMPSNTSLAISDGTKGIARNAFFNCVNLISITIPESVTSIGSYAFEYCSRLTSITIPENSQLTSIGDGAFASCESLTTITIPEGVTSIGYYAFEDCSSLTAVHINDIAAWCNIDFFAKDTNPLGYAENLYVNGELVTKLTIPNTVTAIKDYAFSGCGNLTSITLPESVTSIGYEAFAGCSSLTSITIPGSVTSIGSYAFYYCSSLTSITIPENSQLTSIGSSAFSATVWYKNQPDGVVYIGKVLYRYKGSMPDNTSVEVKEGIVGIAGSAFLRCSSLTSITIPESVTSIGSHAFEYCSSLTSITLPESVTNIGIYAFRGCSSLASITIPENSQLTSIGDYAFQSCSSLTSITIPESVTSIGSYAFRGCSRLTSIKCKAAIPPTVGSSTFENVDKSIPVYVPAGSVAAYQSATYWNEFTCIQPSEETITINQYGSGTYCSEYALDFSEVEGLKAYAATGFNTETGIVTLTRVMTSKPGKGLFIKGEPGEYVVPKMEKTNDNSLNLLVGTLEDVTVGKLSSDERYANYKYTIKAGDVDPMFHNFDDGFALSAGKAYLQIPVEWLPTMEARSIGIRFDDGDGATDIDNAEIRNQKSEIVYDLMGRRVASPKKGELYIIDGKKVIY